MRGISPLRPEHERHDPRRLLLDAWRREADSVAKKMERSDDAAGGLLTACLTVGAGVPRRPGMSRPIAPSMLCLAEVGIAGLWCSRSYDVAQPDVRAGR